MGPLIAEGRTTLARWWLTTFGVVVIVYGAVANASANPSEDPDRPSVDIESESEKGLDAPVLEIGNLPSYKGGDGFQRMS